MEEENSILHFKITLFTEKRGKEEEDAKDYQVILEREPEIGRNRDSLKIICWTSINTGMMTHSCIFSASVVAL